MTTQNTTQVAGTKQYINLATKKKGFLAHDAKYFDRTCNTCKGMYPPSQAACLKCGQPLSYFMVQGKDGFDKAMAITECTIFPMTRKDDEERLNRRLAVDKNMLPITYRFKMFSFAENNILSPPPELMRLKKGAMVEFVCLNAPEYAREYYSEKLERKCVELMYLIYKDRGSAVKVISDPKQRADYAIPYQADITGTPTPVAPPFPKEAAELQKAINEMEKKVAEMKAATASIPASPPQTATTMVGDDPFAFDGPYVIDDNDDSPPF